MDPKLKKLLDSELDLSAEADSELARLQELVGREFDKLDGDDPSDEALSQMEKLASVAEDLAGVRESRRVAASERAGKAAALRSRITGEPDDDAPDEPAEGAGGDQPATEPDKEPQKEPSDDKTAVAAKEPVTAAARRPSRRELAKTAPRPAATPRLVAGGALVASADLLGIGAGEPLGWRQLAESMARKVEMLGGGEVQQVMCASLMSEYPDERRLGDDPWANSERLDGMFAPQVVMRRVADQGFRALVAAGGICDPVPVDYNIPVQAVSDRPVRDALPAFQATRGGVRFITPPTFAGVGSSASTIWTSAIDATATSATPKPVQEFACPTTVQELVDAIPTRVQFSNMQARFSPEIVAANTQLALANAARVAEQNLLAKIAARSTLVGTGQVASFARDLFALLELLAQGYRYRNRLPDMYPLRFLAPMWAKGALRTDILRETAHAPGMAPEDDPLAVGDARITELFANRGVIPTWTIDGLGKSVAGTTLSAANTPFDWPDQFFSAQASGALAVPVPDASANSAVAGTYWPKRLTFFLFAEGTFVYLDGGRIDLGIIRDSVLNNLNKYQTFVEPFEGIARRGYESIQCTVPVALQGTSFATVAPPAVSALPY